MEQERSSAQHLLFLDGIRGLAALFVVVHHIFVTGFLGSSDPRVNRLIFNVIGQGHLAVDVFIVLSGFCLMLPVARSGRLPGGARGFYFRRARRILPTFYFGFALAALIPVLSSFTSHPHVWPPFTGRGFLINGLLLQDLFVRHRGQVTGTPLGEQFSVPFWSVAVECQIYVLFPLLVRLWRDRGAWAVIVFTSVLGYGVMAILTAWKPWLDLSHTCPWYVLLFGAGMCAAAAFVGGPEGGRRTWTGFALLGAAATAYLLTTYPFIAYPAYAARLPLIDPSVGILTAASLVLLGWRQTNLSASAARLLSWRPFVLLGTFAYSVYLTHWTLLVQAEAWVRSYAIAHSVTQQGQDWIMWGIAFPATLLCAYLFFLACERPFLVRRRREMLAEAARDAVLSPAP